MIFYSNVSDRIGIRPVGYKEMSSVFATSKLDVGKFPDFTCSARDWDGKDYLRIIPRVVLVEDPRLLKGPL